MTAGGGRHPAAAEAAEGIAAPPPPSSAAEAVRSAIAASVARLILHDAAVRAGRDPEAVHQARVATRRLRSDLRTFRPVLDADWSRRLRADLHQLADLLGQVRDTDVMLGRLRSAVASLPAADRQRARPLLDRLVRSRQVARAALLRTMRSRGYAALLDELMAAAAAPRFRDGADREAATVLAPLARKPWRAVRRRVRTLGDAPTDPELHEVRILAKRARYAAEAVAPVAGRRVGRLAKALADLQDVLGEHHDAVVAEDWIRRTAAHNGAGSLAAGELIGLERAAAARTREEWRSRWKAARRVRPGAWR